jgi:hypothetical protein
MTLPEKKMPSGSPAQIMLQLYFHYTIFSLLVSIEAKQGKPKARKSPVFSGSKSGTADRGRKQKNSHKRAVFAARRKLHVQEDL